MERLVHFKVSIILALGWFALCKFTDISTKVRNNPKTVKHNKDPNLTQENSWHWATPSVSPSHPARYLTYNSAPKRTSSNFI